MVELEVNGTSVDLEKGTSIKFTKQVADLFDIGNVANSYTTAFTIPNTPKNAQTLQMLGITGDTSSVPYSQVFAALKYHGFSLVRQGWLNVKESGVGGYKGSILDGMIDFFKAIENKTMGVALNLENFEHEKNVETVVESFTNDYYRYIIADYNGRNQINVEFETGDPNRNGINIDYMVPCFNVAKLLELVMTTFGFTYSDLNIEELNELYITYPKSTTESTSETLYADLYKDFYITEDFVDIYTNAVWAPSQQAWTTQTVTTGAMQSDGYVVPIDGIYRLNLSVETYGNYAISGVGASPMGINVAVFVNNEAVIDFMSNPLEAVTGTATIFLNQGDIVTRKIVARKKYGTSPFVRTIEEIRHNSTYFKIYKVANISITDAFKDFQIKDFFKECLWYTGTTPVINQATNVISFVKLIDKLNTTNAIDYSDKFIARTKEIYTSGSFAQKNAFTHKYNQENDISQDGYLNVNNANLEDKKTIVASKIYAPEQTEYIFYDSDEVESFTSQKFRIWDVETKEENDGTATITYKGLNGRFYWLKINQSPVSEWILASELVESDPEIVEQVPYADIQGSTFSQIVPVKYAEYENVLNNMRVHTISLALTLPDFLDFDMNRAIYIEQEATYYIVNKVSFEEGAPSIAECFRISKRFATPAVFETISINLRATSTGKLFISVPKVNGYDIPVLVDSSGVVDGDTYPVEGFSLMGSPNMSLKMEDITGDMILNSFTIRVSTGSIERDYVYNGVPVPFSALEITNNTTKTITAQIQAV